jgi:tRNA-modifying protein YgfZ
MSHEDIAYAALRGGAGVVDRSDRGRLLLTGKDRRAYLQGLLTNDIEALAPGAGCYAAYLTAQGRMIADLFVFETGDSVVIDLEGDVAAGVRDKLAQFIFSEDVEVADISAGTVQFGVYGPRAGEASVAAGALARYVIPRDDFGIAGFDLIAGRERGDALLAALHAAGAVDVDREVAEIARIEAGRPKFGVDMDTDTIPLEAGIDDRAISRTKGCYVGQEVIIRVLDRGHGRVARRLVQLSFDPVAPVPHAGEAIRSGEREIGRITSAVRSPALGRPIALGYVHRDFAAPGTAVTVGEHSAFVREGPFV